MHSSQYKSPQCQYNIETGGVTERIVLTHSTIASIALRDSDLVEQYQQQAAMSNIKEQIRAEIERQKEYSRSKSDKANSNRMKYYFDGADEMCNQLLAFIDSLPEEHQPIDGNKTIEPSGDLDVTDFSKPLDPDVARAIADNLDYMYDEQSNKDLEEAAKTFATLATLSKDTYVDGGAYRGFIAGAKWQAEHQEKKIADAYEKGKQEGIRIVRSWESSPGQGGY